MNSHKTGRVAHRIPDDKLAAAALVAKVFAKRIGEDEPGVEETYRRPDL
ncbi:MAG: hypothetical protein ABI693_23455 [Bryobacteraceae bacterium]